MLILSCGIQWRSQSMSPGMMFPGDRTKISDEDYDRVKELHDSLNNFDYLSEEKKVNAIIGVLNPEHGGGNLLHAIARKKLDSYALYLEACLNILVNFNDPFLAPVPHSSFSALACSAIMQRDASGKTPLDYASVLFLEIFFDYLDPFLKENFINDPSRSADGKSLWDRAWSNMSCDVSLNNTLYNNSAMYDVYDERFELIIVLLKNLSDTLRNDELIMGSRYEYIPYDDSFYGKEVTKGLPIFYPLPYLVRHYKVYTGPFSTGYDVVSAKVRALKIILTSLSGQEAREKAIIQKIAGYHGNSFQMAVEYNQPSDVIQILINNLTNKHLDVLLKGLPGQKTRDKVIMEIGELSMQSTLSQAATDDKLERLKILMDLMSPANRERACKDLKVFHYNNLIQQVASEKQFKALKLILTYKIFSDDELSKQLKLLTEGSSDLFSSIDHARVIVESLESEKSKDQAITRIDKDGASLLHCVARKILNKQDEKFLQLLIENVYDKDLLKKTLENKDNKGESVFDIYPEVKNLLDATTGLPAKIKKLKKNLEALKQKLQALQKGLGDLAGALKVSSAAS